MEPFAPEILWLVVVGFVISFILAFGVGANDVANSYGTSVGSGVLTFRQACVLATIFETAGSILLGYKVSDTMRKGILDVTLYQDSEKELMLGMIATLAGSAAWLLVATYFKLPVSTTHSIVGSTVGFSLVARGAAGIDFYTLGTIVMSWFISPIMSGMASVLLLTLIRKLIIEAKNPIKAGLLALPIIYALTIFVNVLTVTMNGSKLLAMENLKLWEVLAISFGTMIVVGVACHFFVVPWQRKKILSDDDELKIKVPNTNQIGSVSSVSTIAVSTVSLDVPVLRTLKEEDEEKVNKLFHFLQTLTAVFSSFAHGGNDVSNAIGPLIAVWMIYTEGSVLQKSESPLYLLLYGGLGMCVGLWFLGRRVNDTIGKSITKITPTTGFTVESSAAATVLLASKLGVPISSTHCIVGSVVFVGWISAKTDDKGRKIDWSLFRSIVYAWLITLPAAGVVSAFLMLAFKYTLLK